MQKSINFHLFAAIFIFECGLIRAFVTDTFLLRPSIYLSINPINHNLDINWFNLKFAESENASVFISADPNDALESFVYKTTLTSQNGRHQTPLKHNFTEIDEETSCYGYWFTYAVNNEVQMSGCLRARPNWMYEMKNLIKDRKIRELFVPGTHDSSSFKKNFEPEWMDTLITKYSLTQDDDIKSQLMHGIRYLDLRVGYYRSNDEKFWANHGITRLQPLTSILKQVKDFIDATKEIVILDFQEFPVGFRNSIEIHQQFIAYLTQHLDQYATYPGNGWETTLSDIWRSGNRVIVAYDHFGIVGEHSETLLFHSVRQRWGKVKEGFPQLEQFLQNQRENMSREPNFNSRPYAEMAELTPEAIDVLTDRYGGLRVMADKVNFNVTKLYHGVFGKNANVVAVDFYLATNIVEIAIEWNRRKFGGMSRSGEE